MPPTPTVFVAFGITGDLMRLKILPALFALHTKKELAEDFTIIGVSRKEWSDTDLESYVAGIVGQDELFLQRLQFMQGDIEEAGLFETLGKKIGNRGAVLYFSLSPALYKLAFEKLVRSPLAKPFDAVGKSDRVRLMIEKPFGTDTVSAQELNTLLHSTFDEKNIYRVDHYLAKESLHILPPLETRKVKSMHLYFWETVGVEKRGKSYDTVGALRDVGQNHLLEMLATALTEVRPASIEERTKALEGLAVLTPAAVAAQTTHTQYPGYLDIPGVAAGSQTETYFKVKTMWQNIPVTLEGGKHMRTNRKAIAVTYVDGTTAEFAMQENKGRSEYERLIFDCLHGDQQLFVSEQEVALLWRFIDPILKVWYQ